MCCYHPALHLLSQINPTTTSTARPLTLRTSLKVTWPCRCGGVPGLADPQLVTLISGEAPWWAAELLYQRRKDGGMEKGERGQKGGGGRTVKHSWRSVDQMHTLILTHTQTQTHTVHIKRKTEPMWSWRFICWCTTNSFWVVMWNWSDAHLHKRECRLCSRFSFLFI